MSPNRQRILVALALHACLGWPLASQERAPSPTPKVLGHILILDSERCLEGEVEVVEDRYCVRKGMSEVWMPAKKVLRVCTDWKAAVEFMRQRANLDDPDERLRLAKWCQMNHLLEDALVEARAAQDMRPRHGESRHLVMVLRDNLAASKIAPGVAPRPVEPIDSSPVPDLSPESTAQFAARIQPILMNACIGCHASGKGGAFQLYRSADGGHRGATQRNIKMVLSHIRFDQPGLSPLLIKAVSPHGPSIGSPLPGKKSVPYQSLEGWVYHLVAGNPHLREQALTKAASEPNRGTGAFGEAAAEIAAGRPVEKGPAKALPVSPGATEAKKVEPPKIGTTVPSGVGTLPEPAIPSSAPAVIATAPAVSVTPKTAPGSAVPEGRDPYEADSFNRVAHPGR